MKRLLTGAAIAAGLVLSLSYAGAQSTMMNHGAMQNGMMNRGDMPMMDDDDDDASASTKAFRHADRTMMQDMMIDYTGNADVDFVRGMIPHHQGAIDMAKVELEYGKDPEIRKLAEGIIKAQTEEIALMNAWLAAHAK